MKAEIQQMELGVMASASIPSNTLALNDAILSVMAWEGDANIS